jgi:uncharacterized protein with gpF-like domain
MSPVRLWNAMPDPTVLWATVPYWVAKVRKLVSWLQTEATGAGTDRLRGEHPNLRIPNLLSTDSFTQAHLARVENYLVRIPDEVYQLIFAEVSEGIAEGEGVREVQARVDRVLDTSGSENWRNRARVIAITEVNGAANAGWYASAVNAQRELGVRLNKVWLASHDTKVRPSHREADGQRRPLTEPFLVGGFPLLYPGDKNGPPEEVINCRCAAGTKETS